MKKISLILLTLLFIFLPVSCKSADDSVVNDLDNCIFFAFDIYENGEVKQSISFPTQEVQMNLGEKERKEYINSLCLEIKSKLFFPFFLNFYTTSVLGQGEYKIGEDLIYEEPSYDEQSQSISFSFTFKDSDVWTFFHPQNGEEEGIKFVKGFFVDKGKTQSKFLFCEKLKIEGQEQTYGEYLSTILSTTQSKFYSKEMKPPKLAYVYNHFSTKLHTNADKVVHSGNKITNIWECEFEELDGEKNIEIYIYSPNRIVWYLVATGGVILVMTITVIAYNLRNRKIREKN